MATRMREFNPKIPPMQIRATHKGITIDYDEERNEWVFTFEGLEKRAKSYVLARNKIDEMLNGPKKRKKKWEPIKAYLKKWGGLPEPCVITSFIDDGVESKPFWRAWVTTEGDKLRRTKESLGCLFPRSVPNDRIVTQAKAIEAEIETLEKQRDELLKKMEPLEVPEAQ